MVCGNKSVSKYSISLDKPKRIWNDIHNFGFNLLQNESCPSFSSSPKILFSFLSTKPNRVLTLVPRYVNVA